MIEHRRKELLGLIVSAVSNIVSSKITVDIGGFLDGLDAEEERQDVVRPIVAELVTQGYTFKIETTSREINLIITIPK